MVLAIRRACVEDITEMHRIRTAVAENRLADPQRVTEESYRPYLLDRGKGWIAEEAGAMAGFAVLDVEAQSVWALFVHPEAEGGGVGKALLKKVTDWAASEGIERLSLTTAAGTRAEGFYQQAGWVRLGEVAGGEVAFELRLGAPVNRAQ